MRRALPWWVGGALLVWGLLAWPFTVDDAYVLGRYARRLAGGNGYTMNDGPPTDGVTGPLGLLPGVFGQWLFGRPVAFSKAVGLLAVALAGGWVTHAAQPGRARWGVASWLSATGMLGIWAVGGLETGLAVLAFTTMGLALYGEPGRRQGALLGASVCALAWLRPETAPAALMALLWCPAPARRVAYALAGLGLMSVLTFRLWMFGSPVPLSAVAKPAELTQGALYVIRGAMLLWGGVGVLALWMGLRSRRWRPGAAVVLTHLAAVAVAGGDWMPGFRLLLVAVPLSAFVLAGVWASPEGKADGWLSRVPTLAMFAAVVPAVVSGLALAELPAVERSRRGPGARLAERLAHDTGPVALVDIGYLGFVSGVEVVDLGGITDPEVGRLAGGHVDKRVQVGWLADRDPSLIVLHSVVPPRVVDGRLRAFRGHRVEHRVAQMRWVERYYRVSEVIPYAPNYHYIVLERRPGARTASVAQ